MEFPVTLSILVLAIFRAQTKISTDKSGFLTLTTIVRATGLGALASDKLYNRPFPSSGLAHLQSEPKCEMFVMKISFYSYVK